VILLEAAFGSPNSYKVGFRSYQEPFFDSCGPFREFMVAAFATFASLERAKISERTMAGLAKARSQGRVGGRPKKDEDRATMKILHKLKSSGLSVRKIAAEMGISPTTVQKLSRQAVS
jgi:DNA invertase Pin-like site-specific DNA recombinase